MSDLSKVLGDLYGGDDQPSVAPPRDFRAQAPEWADEERLDDAFSDWTPGPPADAPAAEREMSVVIDTPAVPAARLDDDLAAAMSAALVDAGNPDPEVPAAAAPSYSIPAYGEDPAAAMFPPLEPVPVAPPPAPVEEWIEPVPVVVEPPRPWSRLDDDILPAKGVKLPKVKLPKAPKAAKAPKAPKLRKAKGDAAPVVAALDMPAGAVAPVDAAGPSAPSRRSLKLPTPKAKGPKAPKVPKAPKPESADGEVKKVFGITLSMRRPPKH